ncbi:MAG: acyl-CoA thioesterase [Myxococcaceae bacterium]
MDERRYSAEFRLRVTARKEDIDELSHVSNIVYVRWMQDVAVAHSSSVGWTPEAYLRSGRVFVVRRHEIEYFGSAVEGDEVELVTWIDEVTAATSLRRTRMVRVRDGAELVRGATLWVLVSTAKQRPVRIPEEILTAFSRP